VLAVLVALHQEPLVSLGTILYLTRLPLLAVVMVVTMDLLPMVEMVDLAAVMDIQILV